MSSYRLARVSAKGEGERAVASELVWVIGKGEALWNGDEGHRMTVVASKSKCAPGDTALLAPQTQLPGALALVTLERDSILSYPLREVASRSAQVRPNQPRRRRRRGR